jgi:hypothetical protein
MSTVSCQAWIEGRDSSNESNQRFLEILSGPTWAKYDSATLVREGHKACDAFAQGQSASQVMDTFQQDMDADAGMAGQFVGAVAGGLNCYPR